MKVSYRRWMSVALMFVSAAILGCGKPAEDVPINIGGQLQLFVDRHLIDRFEGEALLRLHRPTMQEVVLIHDKNWEGNTSGYHTIFKDGDRYRMYYRGWHHLNKHEIHPPVTCYAESLDGIHWKRPNLGIIEFAGSKNNNIIWSGKGAHNFTPFKDKNPDCLKEAKYKAVGGSHKPGLFAFQSADGIHWKRITNTPIITEGTFDSQNLVFWDTVRSEYRSYFRDFRDGTRDIKTATSKDFLQWSKPEWLEYPGATKEHLYTNQIQPYYRAPQLFIGFPSRYIPDRGSLLEGLFITSRDGRTFQRWEEAVIRPGRNRERWHNRSNYIWLGLVETKSSLSGGGKELSIYTNERYYKGPGSKTRRFTYRIDGFVSVYAPFSGGSLVTKPFVFSGSKLLLNVSTSAAGTVRVEVQNADGDPISGYEASNCIEIYGDEIERTVMWRLGSDVRHLQGQPIRLRFQLKDADLYAFRFNDSDES